MPGALHRINDDVIIRQPSDRAWNGTQTKPGHRLAVGVAGRILHKPACCSRKRPLCLTRPAFLDMDSLSSGLEQSILFGQTQLIPKKITCSGRV
jgi:hypothetical protein